MRSIVTTVITSFMLMVTVNGQGEWEIVNEGFAYDFSYIDFISKDTGWIAEKEGLFKTTDGAENWALVYDDTTLHEIDFYNDTIGWAYVKSEFQTPDPDACILKTLDGGYTWYRQKKVSDGHDLCVVTDSVVYSCGNGDGVFRTFDGGTSWKDITPSQGSYFRSAYFYTADTGIVFDNHDIIFRTFDGGETWDRINTGFESIYDIKLIDGSSGYFIARNNTSSLICKTTDTFNNWSVIAEDSVPFLSYDIFDDDTIIALKTGSGSNRYITKSTDGGKTWKDTDHMQLIADGWFYRINLSVVENVAYLFAWSGNMSFILKSTDQGDHWKCLNLTFPMQGVHFVNKDSGFIAGSYRGFHHRGGNVLMTQDEGKTWNPVYNPGFIPGNIHFLNDSIGFIHEKYGGNVFATSDGGKTWVADDDIVIKDVYTVNDSISWLLVSNDDKVQIQKTNDGGKSWEVLYNIENGTIASRDFASLLFREDNTGFIVGNQSNHNIIKFSEQETWEIIESGTTLPLNKVFFVDQEFGLIAGGYNNGGDFEDDFGSILLITEDGGDHWFPGPEMPYLLHDIFFLDSLHGFAVGEDAERHGVLLETIDRGSSWNKISLEKNFSGPLRALHFKDGIGWAVGENSLILKYEMLNTSNQDLNLIHDEDHLQNYPNPFHSRTMISYSLPASGDVELSIYDLSGRKVTALVKEQQQAGKHELEWSTEGMQSGIYFCALETKHCRQVIKLILID